MRCARRSRFSKRWFVIAAAAMAVMAAMMAVGVVVMAVIMAAGVVAVAVVMAVAVAVAVGRRPHRAMAVAASKRS